MCAGDVGTQNRPESRDQKTTVPAIVRFPAWSMGPPHRRHQTGHGPNAEKLRRADRSSMRRPRKRGDGVQHRRRPSGDMTTLSMVVSNDLAG